MFGKFPFQGNILSVIILYFILVIRVLLQKMSGLFKEKEKVDFVIKNVISDKIINL